MEIKYPTIHYFDASDGYRFAVRVWDHPEGKADVVVLHGIVSHGGWYLASCSFLCEHGFRVHFLDRRGSGLNLGARGDVPDLDRWLKDVAEYLLRRATIRPRILLGISWGAKLAIAVAKQHPELCDAFGLIGPGLYAYQQAGTAKQVLLRLLRSLGLGLLRITIPLQDPRLFTENPRWLWYLATDPLSLRKVTVRFAVEDLKLNRLARTDPESVAQPALLMLAGRDRITDNARTRRFFQQLGGDKRLIEYPAAHHTLEFEQDPSGYFRDLAEWVDKQVIAFQRRSLPR
ncbi:MAG: lysophospholipase [Thermoguttaceae bacterium]|nr:lysophospholipase [Thermoguttaceae bacterium]MDW8078099.1 alpha/beta fold hydrolase [Thermoguttaceae bacterium]